jgi:hypothetical protein
MVDYEYFINNLAVLYKKYGREIARTEPPGQCRLNEAKPLRINV